MIAHERTHEKTIALSHLLDNIYTRFGTKLYRQIVGIPIGTNRAPLEAELFYTPTKEISYILVTMTIEAFNSTTR